MTHDDKNEYHMPEKAEAKAKVLPRREQVGSEVSSRKPVQMYAPGGIDEYECMYQIHVPQLMQMHFKKCNVKSVSS